MADIKSLVIGALLAAGALLTNAASAQQSTLDVVKSRGILIVGLRTDLVPGGFIDKQNNWVGIDVDMAEYVANKLGVKLQREKVTSSTRIPLLVNGNIDLVLCTMAPTSERAKAIDFTMPYYNGGQRILTKKDSGIQSVKDLAAPRKTGTTQGSFDGVKVLEAQPKAELVYYQEWALAWLALKQGRIDAISTADTSLKIFAKDDPNFVIVGPPISSDPWAMGVRHNDSKWRLFLDQTIMQAWSDGTIAKIYDKYVGGEPPYSLFVWTEYEKKEPAK